MLFLNLSDTISQKALLRTAIRNSAFVILFGFSVKISPIHGSTFDQIILILRSQLRGIRE